MFQQGLALCQTSSTAKEKMTKLKLRMYDSAPKSQDLNPVEIIWSILEKKLAVKPIYSKVTLIEHPQEEWNNIDKDLCTKLVESMPERIRKYLKAKERHFL